MEITAKKLRLFFLTYLPITSEIFNFYFYNCRNIINCFLTYDGLPTCPGWILTFFTFSLYESQFIILLILQITSGRSILQSETLGMSAVLK